MLHSAYKHFSCLNLAEVTSKSDSKTFKVATVDGILRKFSSCVRFLNQREMIDTFFSGMAIALHDFFPKLSHQTTGGSRKFWWGGF